MLDLYANSKDVCELYCTWLNSFEADDDPYRYSEKDFMYNPDESRYGEWYINTITPSVNGTIEIHTVSMGDEGGPQTLTVFRNDDNTINCILQAFDTGYTVVYADSNCSRMNPTP
jgi:hypothetical protein